MSLTLIMAMHIKLQNTQRVHVLLLVLRLRPLACTSSYTDCLLRMVTAKTKPGDRVPLRPQVDLTVCCYLQPPPVADRPRHVVDGGTKGET